MIGSHNKPPPPSNDGERAFIAAVSGEPETPLDVPPLGKEGGVRNDAGKEPLADGKDIELNSDELDTGAGGEPKIDGPLVAVDIGIGGNPDAILENSTGSIPDGIGVPEAAAAAIISAGVGS